MSSLRAFVNGALVPTGEARISVLDQGFRTGEGVFETFRAYGAHVFRLDEHLRRAEEGAAVLSFSPGEHVDLAAAVADTAAANLPALGGADSALRLTVTPGRLDPDSAFPGTLLTGPTVAVTSHRLEIPPDLYERGATAVSVPWTRQLPQVKSVSYLSAILARRRARSRGADEALLTTDDGEVLEGAGSNVFAVFGDRLVTPPVEAGLLAGVTRGVVLQVAAGGGLRTTEEPLPVDVLQRADEAFLTATTREIVPLVAVDGAAVGDGSPGGTTTRLLGAYRDEVARERSSPD